MRAFFHRRERAQPQKPFALHSHKCSEIVIVTGGKGVSGTRFPEKPWPIPEARKKHRNPEKCPRRIDAGRASRFRFSHVYESPARQARDSFC